MLEIDRNLLGCVAVHLYTEEKKAELACLYVDKAHEGQGYGRKLMSFAEQLAAEKGMRQLFALSTQAFNFFQQKGGFIEIMPMTCRARSGGNTTLAPVDHVRSLLPAIRRLARGRLALAGRAGAARLLRRSSAWVFAEVEAKGR